jgi:hypoxanthine phosphoribosyltransferase
MGIMLPHTISQILFTEGAIQERVRELGAQIAADHPDASEPLLLVGVLKGASLFLADLVRNINRPIEFDFVVLSSYSGATETTGEVQILKDLDVSVAGKSVVIVEDILDTGLTLGCSRLVESLLERRAKSVRVCVLLDKPSRRRVAVPVDYCGFQIEDRFAVGYGMDYAERYRNLPYIGVLEITEQGATSAPLTM